MGSICCVASRPRDFTDGWSVGRTRVPSSSSSSSLWDHSFTSCSQLVRASFSAIAPPSEQTSRVSAASSQEFYAGIPADFEERSWRGFQSPFNILSRRDLLSRQMSDIREKTESWTGPFAGSSRSKSMRWNHPNDDKVLGFQDSHVIVGEQCGLCLKAVSCNSPWGPQKILKTLDLPVIGVLACGHVYHAECLERATPLTRLQNPPCPECDALKLVQWKEKSGCSSSLKARALGVKTEGCKDKNTGECKASLDTGAVSERGCLKLILKGQTSFVKTAGGIKNYSQDIP